LSNSDSQVFYNQKRDEGYNDNDYKLLLERVKDQLDIVQAYDPEVSDYATVGDGLAFD
jgi:hypothetical protein